MDLIDDIVVMKVAVARAQQKWHQITSHGQHKIEANRLHGECILDRLFFLESGGVCSCSEHARADGF